METYWVFGSISEVFFFLKLKNNKLFVSNMKANSQVQVASVLAFCVYSRIYCSSNKVVDLINLSLKQLSLP